MQSQYSMVYAALSVIFNHKLYTLSIVIVRVNESCHFDNNVYNACKIDGNFPWILMIGVYLVDYPSDMLLALW